MKKTYVNRSYSRRGSSRSMRIRAILSDPQVKTILVIGAAAVLLAVILGISCNACRSCGGCSGCSEDEIVTPTTSATDALITVSQTDTPPAPQTKIVTAVGGSVNVRADAGTSATKLGEIQVSDYYNVLETKADSEGTDWYKILFEGQEGYICGKYVSVINGYVSDNKTAYLTFDDGPSKNTTEILDVLDFYNVKATFFVVYRENREDLYKEIVSRGHSIALHSYTHDYDIIYKSPEAFFGDMDNLSNYIKSLTGAESKIIRFPGGSSNIYAPKSVMRGIAEELRERGYEYFDWNVDSGDADRASVNADVLVKNIQERCEGHKNVMILMHDAPTKDTTAEALPDIIEYLIEAGYEILPITEDTPPVHHIDW